MGEMRIYQKPMLWWEMESLLTKKWEIGEKYLKNPWSKVTEITWTPPGEDFGGIQPWADGGRGFRGPALQVRTGGGRRFGGPRYTILGGYSGGTAGQHTKLILQLSTLYGTN